MYATPIGRDPPVRLPDCGPVLRPSGLRWRTRLIVPEALTKVCARSELGWRVGSVSMQPELFIQIPESTRRVAVAAFPKGSMCMRLRDALGTVFSDEEFADLFPGDGRPAESPGRLALALVLQYAEGLSDRQAADAVRGRLDWKYALALELEDSGFDFSMF
jgi:hypothetical protein